MEPETRFFGSKSELKHMTTKQKFTTHEQGPSIVQPKLMIRTPTNTYTYGASRSMYDNVTRTYDTTAVTTYDNATGIDESSVF